MNQTREDAMPQRSSPMHSPAHGYARGIEARQRIIEVAITAFGNLGFDNASTRGIAKLAKVNLGSLRYYFGSKERLYRACAEHIADLWEGRLAEFHQRIQAQVEASDQSREQVLQITRRLVETILDHLVIPRRPYPWVMFLIREQLDPGVAYDILYERLTRRFMALWSGLVGRILGRPADNEVSVLKTFCIVGQLFSFDRNLYTVKRSLGWDELNPRRLTKVKQVLWQQIESGLAGDALPSAHPE
jgi:AcrR family transcriptional regulator